MTSAAPRPRALTIAGSDSGGGAGIQADLKTFSALGVFGMTAITAVTVQNTRGVESFEAISPATVRAQIRAVATDIGVDAAKTGMLANAEIVEAVADAIEETGIRNLTVDPVFVSKHGHLLLAEDAVEALRSRILPLATLVTPNLPEAAGLAGITVASRADMRRAAEAILGLGAGAVLVKGGHLEGEQRGGRPVRGRRPGGMDHRRADRHAEHPRHGLHPVGGDHGAPGDGRRVAGRGARREGVRDGGDPTRAGDRRGDRTGGSALVGPARGPAGYVTR